METYDYTEGGAGCDISSQIDAMSARELQAAAEAIRTIRQTAAGPGSTRPFCLRCGISPR